MFDPKEWVHAENITVKQFCDYLLENVPANALFCVCGDSQVYMHMEENGSIFCVDDSPLSDLEEYKNCEIREFEVNNYDA